MEKEKSILPPPIGAFFGVSTKFIMRFIVMFLYNIISYENTIKMPGQDKLKYRFFGIIVTIGITIKKTFPFR